MKKIITILSLLLSLSHLCFGAYGTYVACVATCEPKEAGTASISGAKGDIYTSSLCISMSCSGSISMSAQASSGYKFAYWSATFKYHPSALGNIISSATIINEKAMSTNMEFIYSGKYLTNSGYYALSGTDTIYIVAHFVPSSLTLTTSALPAEGGTVTEGGSFEYGTNKTIEATPNPDYQFVMWDDGSTDNPRSIVVTGNATYTAIFEPTGQTSPNNSNGALSGLFSVSANKTVRFSMGNLQYRASTNTWRFAMNQWHAIGQDNANIASDYDGWIDMFGWGTSGWNSGAVCYQPFSSSKNDSDYYVGGNSKNNLIGDYANADWGVYNKITNGGNQVGLWNTLTTEEWKYLIEERTNANNLRGIGTVNGMNGLILLPDKWDTPEGLEFNTNFGSETNRNLYPTTNSFTLSQWKQMEDRGAIFLPACDLGHEITSNFNVLGHYWSSVGVENLRFSSQDIKYQVNNRYPGMSVRLVQESYSIQVVPSDVEKGETSGNGVYRKNEEVEITATPNPDYQFVMWNDGSTDNPRSIVVTGNATYTATFSYVGHSYGVPTYEWNTDSTQCTATRICSNNVSHIETETATSSIDTTAATCITTGLITYTVNFTNTAFTAQTVTKEIPVLGHDYQKDSWSWSSDYKTVSVKFICQNNNDHVETINAVVTTDTTKATCIADGKIVYTAKATFEGTEYTDTKEVTLPALKPTTHTITEISYGEFTLNGQTYNESGVYTQMLTNSQGCDSVLTINLTVKKEEDLELSVLEQFTTCEYRDAIQIESYTEGMNFTWSINGEIDKTQTGDTYRIPSSAPLNGIVKVTGTIGTISISKTIQYSIYKEIAKKMWDDVVSIINPKHEFVAFEWYHNDKKISNAEYYNELGGVTGSYYVIATDKENEKIHSCILNFEANSQLKLFPNPTEGEVTFINDGNTEVRIFDTTGKLLATETIIPTDGYSTIDLSSYPQGIYYLHIGKNIFKVVRK